MNRSEVKAALQDPDVRAAIDKEIEQQLAAERRRILAGLKEVPIPDDRALKKVVTFTLFSVKRVIKETS